MARDARWPSLEKWSALGLAGLLTLAAVLDGSVGSGSFVSSPVTLLLAALSGCLLGAWTPQRITVAGVAAVATALTYANQRHFANEYPPADDLAFFLIVVGAPALLGAALVARIRQVRELDALHQRRAVQRRDEITAARLAEQQHIEMAVQHRLVERLGAIALRAEGARDEDGRSPTDSLAQIEQAARTGLDELRRALGVLREEPSAAVTDRDDSFLPARPTRDEPPVNRRDVLLVAGLGAAMAIESVVSSAARGPQWASVLLAFAVTGPLLVRRHHPLLAVVATMGLGTAYSAVLTPLPAMVTAIAPFLATAYTVGAFTRGGRRVVGLAVLWLGLVLLGLVSPAGTQDPEGIVPTLVWSGLAVGAGVLSASWSDRARQKQAVLAELERLRDVDVHLAVAQQRQRIARDLHDTVAHTLSVVCLNAGAGQCPGASTADAMRVIADAARAGMGELRPGLHALEPEERLDAPSVRLMAKRLGIDLSLTAPASADITALDSALLLRVLRESLVNVARHAAGARADAVITVDEAFLRIEVVDSGAAPEWSGGGRRGAGAELGAGVGLSGLATLVRERGGTLEFGPLPQRGFRVAASLPRPASSQLSGPRVSPTLVVPARSTR